jgi:cyclohexa-1,5-dienecarbonyl-CoA hydratase
VLLPLRIGQARAEDLLFSGRTIAGTTAVAWGLAAEAAEEPETAALIYFDKHFADKSAAALACAVHAARAPFAELARARLDEMEAYYLQAVMATRDAHEGLAAFIAKRPPVWEHR